MKKTLTFALLLFASLFLYAQSALDAGNSCFRNGDYDCAIANYNKAIIHLSGKDRRMVEVNILRAETCKDLRGKANTAFNRHNYKDAAGFYQDVLDECPDDAYAKDRHQLSVEESEKVITLNVLPTSLNFESSGGSRRIDVNTNADDYSISALPWWIKVKKESGYITVTVESYTGTSSRESSFELTARDKKVEIKVTQSAPTKITLSTTSIEVDHNESVKHVSVETNEHYYLLDVPFWCTVTNKSSGGFTLEINPNSSSSDGRYAVIRVKAGDKEVGLRVYQKRKSSPPVVTGQTKSSPKQKTKKPKPIKRPSYSSKCFNCPQAKNTFGVTTGYSMLSLNAHDTKHGLLLGFKIEPLFKHGFGLNTGLNIEWFLDEDDSEPYYFNFSIPLHLEYRLHLSKSFQLFGLGGISGNLFTDEDFIDVDFPLALEFGGGIRWGVIQLAAVKSEFFDGELTQRNYYGDPIELNYKWAFSLSFMF